MSNDLLSFQCGQTNIYPACLLNGTGSFSPGAQLLVGMAGLVIPILLYLFECRMFVNLKWIWNEYKLWSNIGSNIGSLSCWYPLTWVWSFFFLIEPHSSAWVAGYGLWNGTQIQKDDSNETSRVDIIAASFKLRMAPFIFEKFCGNSLKGKSMICILLLDRDVDYGDSG